MEDRKDISDMSFEEFFAEQKVKKEKASERAEAAKARKEAAMGDHQPGFQGSGPKLNFTNWRVMVYIPRYTAGENSRFEVAVEVGEDVVPLGRLNSIKQRSSRVSRPDTLDITGAGVKPFSGFTITIDGNAVFELKPCDILFFNNMGSQMRKPFGDVYAVREPGVRLKLSRAEPVEEFEKNGLLITHLTVQATGGIWVDDSEYVPEPEAEEAEEVHEEAPEEPKKKEAPKKKPAKKCKGSIELPAGIPDADIVFGKEVLALYDSMPVVGASAEGCELSECEISVDRAGVKIAGPKEASAQAQFKSKDLWGPLDIVLSKGDKALDTKRVFVIPGFSCKHAGKGDIAEDTSISYSVFGQKGQCDACDGDAAFENEGIEFSVRWAVPAVSYDIGSGPVRITTGTGSITASDIKGGKMRIIAKGARKKSVFFGGETGKKQELASNWDGEEAEIDMSGVIDEIYSNPSAKYYLFITVNSFPNRKFLAIGNPERITASFADGKIVVEADASIGDCVCRLYKIDRSQEDVPVSAGRTEVPIGSDVIEAEVVETKDGKARITLPVAVRSLPFVLEDDSGSVWLYVSKSKRIPLPDNLFIDGKPDEKLIKAWYERIVRMNPELKSMPLVSVVNAFKAFSQRTDPPSVPCNMLNTTLG